MTSAWLMVMLAAAPKVASPPWNAVDVKPELVRFYSEQLATALRAEGLQVTTADDISTILGNERQRQLLGCSNESSSCLAELANALGCDATLTVSLARLGKGYRGLAKMMSSRDGSVLSSVKIEATAEDVLADRLEAAAKALAEPLLKRRAVEKVEVKPVEVKPVEPPVEPKPEVAQAPQPTRVAPRGWWIPGAAGVLVGAGAAVCFSVASNLYKPIDQATVLMPVDASAVRTNVTTGSTLQTFGWVGASVGVAAIAGSLLWLLLGSTDAPPQVSLFPLGAGLGVGGAF